MATKVNFPDPDALGVYRFGDGSMIRPAKGNPGRWNAWWADGSPLRDEDDGLSCFGSPGSAAYALSRGGAAMDRPPPPPPAGNEYTLSLDVGNGDKLDVYLRRQSGDPSDPAYFLSTELSFVTPHMTSSVHGLRAKELRALARILAEFADEMESEE